MLDFRLIDTILATCLRMSMQRNYHKHSLSKRGILVGLPLLLFCLTAAPVLTQEIKPAIVEALSRADTASAVDLLLEETKTDKGYHMNYYWLGKILFERGQFAEAMERFQTAFKKKSKHFESLYLLGQTQLKLGLLDEAEASMTLGIKKAKKQKGIFHNGLGLVLLVREKYSDADREFRMALAANEQEMAKKIQDLEGSAHSAEDRKFLMDSVESEFGSLLAEYHINLGDANYYQGIPELAISEYEEALAHDTASTEVFYHWAEACIKMRDYTCAIDKLRVVLSKDSTYANAWLRAGGIYYKAARSTPTREERNSRFKETIGSYKRYLELSDVQPDSASVRVFFELGMSYHSLRGYEDASEYFAKVLSIPIEPRDVHFYYGKSLWAIKRYEECAEELLRHIEWVASQDEDYKPRISDVELHQLLGDAYYYRESKEFSKAISHYKKSLEARPDQKRLIYNVAVAYHTLKSYRQAIEYYDKRIALGIDSSFVSIYKNAGYCALNIANNEGGEEDLDLEEEEEELEESSVEDDRNYYEVALDYMVKYLEFHSEDTKVVLLVANTYLYQLADCAKGVQWFERLLELDPDDCSARKSLGYAYFGGICNKNYSRALAYLTKAYNCLTSSGGGCADVDLTLWIAQCYHLMAADKSNAKEDANDEFKNAYNWYGKVVKCEPGNDDAQKGQQDTRFEFVE